MLSIGVPEWFNALDIVSMSALDKELKGQSDFRFSYTDLRSLLPS